MKDMPVIEIAVGSNDNTRMQIRDLLQSGNPPLFSTFNADQLHCNEFRSFWITWYGGYFIVGKGPIAGEQIMMEWRDNSNRYYNAIGLTTAIGSAAVWKISENSGKN